MNKIVNITRKFSSYNSRRYGKPWGAIVRYQGSRPIYDFVDHAYIGTDAGGEVFIEAKIGDIVAIGQRDNRGSSSVQEWRIILDDGSSILTTAVDAFHHWRARLHLVDQAQPDNS